MYVNVKERKLSLLLNKHINLTRWPHIFLSHTHTGRCTKTHTVDTCRFLSAAVWLAGTAYMKCLLNCRFLVGVIIQAYMHGREGLDFSPESSLPVFLPATSAGYCCEPEILMDSSICFQRSFTYFLVKVFHSVKPTKHLLFVFIRLASSLLSFLHTCPVKLLWTSFVYPH